MIYVFPSNYGKLPTSTTHVRCCPESCTCSRDPIPLEVNESESFIPLGSSFVSEWNKPRTWQQKYSCCPSMSMVFCWHTPSTKNLWQCKSLEKNNLTNPTMNHFYIPVCTKCNSAMEIDFIYQQGRLALGLRDAGYTLKQVLIFVNNGVHLTSVLLM